MPSFFTVNATLDSLSWVDRRGKLVNATDSGSAMITQRANMFPLYSLMFVDSDPPRLDVVVVDSVDICSAFADKIEKSPISTCKLLASTLLLL